ncbi:MAG TPA: hypothetical protein VNA65_01940 [Candidatus Dormibacteraeota bacterium]|nr:hypothetical protein [Candidatus Dormibacteraeota bacterium]
MEQTPETRPAEPQEAAPPPAAAAPRSPALHARRSRRGTITAIALFALIVIGILGYGVAGTVYAASRISTADRALNSVISHQNQLNTTFRSIDAQSATLKSGGNFNVTQAEALIDQFVASSVAAGKTIDQDDNALASSSVGLNDNRWLTAFSRTSLDRESARIVHARKALSFAKTVAADYVLDGHFWRALYRALGDLDQLGAQNAGGDVTGAKATVVTMKSDVDGALQLSSAPGLPPEMHSLMVDFQTLTVDFGKLLDADLANDDAAIMSAEQLVQSDGNKISSYDFDKIGNEINDFYKTYVDGFNSEMAKATA